jgi:hypothetical protein
MLLSDVGIDNFFTLTVNKFLVIKLSILFSGCQFVTSFKFSESFLLDYFFNFSSLSREFLVLLYFESVKLCTWLQPGQHTHAICFLHLEVKKCSLVFIQIDILHLILQKVLLQKVVKISCLCVRENHRLNACNTSCSLL